MRGPSLTIIEATAVLPNGRISPYDSGLWRDEQMAPIESIVAFAAERQQKVGIQLAHAGRKASTRAPWRLSRGMASQVAERDEGGWPDNVVGPSSSKWAAGYAEPREMSMGDIHEVIRAFEDAARRAVKAGIAVIEIHAAHGYLLGSFLSRLTNRRTDGYGGSDLASRARFLIEVVTAVRRVMPAGMPLLIRISATEWLQDPDAWTEQETVELARMLDASGVDVLTLSSGGNSSMQKVPTDKDYQTSLARSVRRELRANGCGILIGALGRISEPKQAEELLTGNEPAGDLILAGRQFMKEPSWVLRVAQELGVKVQWPLQYQLGRYGLETKL